MAKVTAAQKAAAEAQAAELKATAVLEANEAAQAAAEAQAATQDALEMEVFEDAPVADLDTPVAGEEIENGAEVPQNEGPDETGNELQPGDEITDPDPVEIPEEEMQVGDIQDESQDESQDEAMPEDPGAELSGKYDFSAKRLEEYLLSAKPQDKIIQESQGGNFISNMDHTIYVPISLFIK